MFRRTHSLALVFGMAALAPPALADQQVLCGERAGITERLQTHYGERQRSIGLQSSSRMIEIWASSKTGSWTILTTDPNGTTCILATGQDWLDSSDTLTAELGVPG